MPNYIVNTECGTAYADRLDDGHLVASRGRTKDPENTFPVTKDASTRLSDARKKLGLTLEDVAEACGVTPPSVSEVLNHRVRSCQFLRALCRVLEVPFYEVVPWPLPRAVRTLLVKIDEVARFDQNEADRLVDTWMWQASDLAFRLRHQREEEARTAQKDAGMQPIAGIRHPGNGTDRDD